MIVATSHHSPFSALESSSSRLAAPPMIVASMAGKHSLAPGPVATVLVDYASPDGPTVSEARGQLVVSSIQTLKATSLYEPYLQKLSAPARERLTDVLASSWVPLELLVEHCAALDALQLSDRALQEHGEKISQQVSDSTFSMMLRTARGMGVDKNWWILKQCDRIWPRMYRGGGITLLATGPKDAIVEVHGVPLLSSRFFRTAHHAFVAGLGSSLSQTSYAKAVRPREPNPHRAATALSWV